MSYFKTGNAPLFLAENNRKYMELVERGIKSILKRNQSAKPCFNLACAGKHSSKNPLVRLLTQIEKENHTPTKRELKEEFNALFEEASFKYQDFVLNDVLSFLNKHPPDEFINVYKSFLPMRDFILKTYVDARLEQEISSLKDQKLKYSFLRSISIKVRNNETGDLYVKETPVKTHIDDAYIRTSFTEKQTDFFPPEAFSGDVSLFSSHNIVRIVLNQPLKGKVWNSKDHRNLYFELHSRNKSSKRELEKFVDTLLGLRSEWYFDAIGTNEIVTQQRLYDLTSSIREIHNNNSKSSLFNVEHRNLPSQYNSKVLDKIVKDAVPFLSRTPNNSEEYARARDALLRGIWHDHFFGESLVMTPTFFEWYTQSPISHGKGFLINRDAERRGELYSNSLDMVASELEAQFSGMYD